MKIAISEKEDFEKELLNCGYKVSGISSVIIIWIFFTIPFISSTESQKLFWVESLDIFQNNKEQMF